MEPPASINTVKTQAQQFLHWFVIPFLAVALVLWPIVYSNLNLLLNNAGDPLLNLYFLEHAIKHLTSSNIFNPEAFWSPDFFWPVKDILAWSDHLLGQSIIYGFWRLFFNPYQAYAGWLGSSLFLNYISLRWALNRISPSSKAIWISVITLVCSFSPAIVHQVGHPQLLSLFIIGPILYGCHKLLTCDPEEITLADFAGMAGWLLANGFFNIYTFVYSSFCVLICTSIHLIKRIQRNIYLIHPGKRLTLKSMSSLLLVGINLIIYTPYLRTLNTFGRREMSGIIDNLPKPASWLYSTNVNLLPSPIIPGEWIYGAEQELFPGWGVLILFSAAIITTIRAKASISKKTTLLWIMATSLLIILSLSINGISAWPFISNLLPGSSSLRASSRVAMQIILFSSGGIALASQSWKLPQTSFKSIIISVLIFTAGFVSIWPVRIPTFSLQDWRKQLSLINAALTEKECDAFWLEPSLKRPYVQHVQAMHAQMLTGIPTMNGYSGHFPKGEWPFVSYDTSKSSSNLGKRAYGWSISAPLIKEHRLKNRKSTEKKCLIRLDDNSAEITYLNASEAILPQLIYANNNLSIIASGKGKMAFSILDANEWKQAKHIRKQGENIKVDQGDWVIKNASTSDGIMNINLILRGGTRFKQWRVDLKDGEIIDEIDLPTIKTNYSNTPYTGNSPLLIRNNHGVEIAKDRHGRIVFRMTADQAPRPWQAILREGSPIASNRNSFKIIAVRLSYGIIEIIDLNEQQNIAYIWRIDSHSGLFIDQDMIIGEQNINRHLERFGY